MKAIIYSRCSTNETKQDVTLQTAPLVEYCNRSNWAYEIVEEYASGKDTRKRPLLKAIMDKAFRKQFDVLLVTKIDRLARSISDFVDIVQKLDNAGIRFIALDQGVDTDKKSPHGRMFAQMLSVFAEFEVGLIRDRIKVGLDRAKQDGKTLGAPKKVFDVKRAIALTQNEHMSYRKASKAMGIDVNTMIRRIKEYQQL